MWKVREPFWNAASLRCCNAYLIHDLGGSSRTMKWALRACRCDSICAYVLPYHSIFLHTHLGKSGKCRLKPTQTAMTSSMSCRRHRPIWPKLERHVMLCRHVATCRRHFQLSYERRGKGDDMHWSMHAVASHDVGWCDAPLPLHCMLVNTLWIIHDPMAIL